MRIVSWSILTSWTILAAFSIGPFVSAQSTPQNTMANGSGGQASVQNATDPALSAVVSAAMPRSGAWGAVKGVPFSAKQTTVHDQTLSDGTVIKSTVEIQIFRDGEGRMRAESTLNPKVSGQPQTHIVAISNPIDRTEISWVSGSPAASVASVLHMPEMQMSGMMNAFGTGTPVSGTPSRSLHLASAPAVASSPSQSASNIRTEDLAGDSIAGVEVTGTRTTQVIPAGSIDNDRDFSVTSETWVSPELKTTVRQMTSDPRTGTVTTELSNIDRSEPDPALFRAPAGYKTMDLADPTAADSGAKR